MVKYRKACLNSPICASLKKSRANPEKVVSPPKMPVMNRIFIGSVRNFASELKINPMKKLPVKLTSKIPR